MEKKIMKTLILPPRRVGLVTVTGGKETSPIHLCHLFKPILGLALLHGRLDNADHGREL